ncbi:PAS domain-containing protein [Methylobacterium isbiliense]|jgi:PAS domain-containing protein|uniref:histidine kinase n=1 Tax=Methylobacterium isbiliense TaxID=315478 RepID=A0ABQ4SGW2_9HYPH|nr:PAS domain-containing protein [Methylobacterium isbiliense]MDN3625275.1 PAS domain-containing protein [Methylobacterium isbiliense]GJE02460.1 hypothetical protein GMJLKIPL_4409 [Methylobacterium isbiliense]
MHSIALPQTELSYSSPSFVRLLESHHLSGTWSWTFRTDEHVWSPGLLRLLGIDATAVAPSYALLTRLVHPEDAHILESPAQVKRDGIVGTHTVRFIRPDGTLRILTSRGEIYVDPDGRPRAAAGILLDVTDTERLAQAQREEQRRRRALFEQTQSWTHASLYASSRRVGSREILSLTGITQADFQADCTRVIAPDDRSRMTAHIRAMMEAGGPFEARKRLILADGAQGDFRFVYVPIRDEQGRIGSWATLASRLAGPKAAPLDQAVRDGLVQAVEGYHLRAARGLLGWSMNDLARASGLSLSTIRRMEDGAEGTARSRPAAVAALQSAGIGFLLVDGNTLAVAKR